MKIEFNNVTLLPQRLVYRQLMYYFIIKSFNKAMKGQLKGWGVFKRAGNVEQLEVKPLLLFHCCNE